MHVNMYTSIIQLDEVDYVVILHKAGCATQYTDLIISMDKTIPQTWLLITNTDRFVDMFSWIRLRVGKVQ